MKKVVRLTEKDLTLLVQRVLKEDENERSAYGGEEIDKLYSKVSDDEDVYLSDNSGQLRGDIVKKIEVVKRMLREAVNNEDWNLVERVIMYIDFRIQKS